MRIARKLVVTSRKEWRAWLAAHHRTAKEIWVVYYKKHSGKRRIPYNDAVEEALCYGWIDSITKPIDDEKYAQRFTPRKPKANWSAMNIERMRRLVRQKKARKAGIEAAQEILSKPEIRRVAIPEDILKALKKDRVT